MKSRLSLTCILASLVMVLGISLSANAMESSKYKFNKEMQMTIKTVTGNYFKSYDGLLNKPLAQLVAVQPHQSRIKLKEHDNNNFFELAMQMQDKVHYYIAVVDDLFNEQEQEYGSSCETSQIAKFMNIF